MKTTKNYSGINFNSKKLLKISGMLISISLLVIGLTSFAPIISAQSKYKTLAYDKKMDSKQDFEKGNFANAKIEATGSGIDLTSADGGKGEYITPVYQAPFGATNIGLHWKQESVGTTSVTAYIRTSNDGVSFGDWIKTSIEADEGRSDMATVETFASLVGVNKDSYAQAKMVLTPVNGVSPKLKSLTFTFINSGEESRQTSSQLSFVPISSASSLGTLKTSPNGKSVNVISREAWGADESYRLYADGTESWPRSYHGTRKLIVHHTAGLASNGVTDLATNEAALRAIYYYHAVTLGWGDIGYNALVDAAGNVYEGRYGTHDILSRINPSPDQIMVLDVEAGHAASHNNGSFGVSAMGDFTNYSMPAAQLAGVESVLSYVADSRGIDVQGNSDYLRSDGTWNLNLNNMVGHRDVNATACPGNMFYPQLGIVKTDVAGGLLSNLSGFSATINGNPVSGQNVGSGIVNFGWTAFTGATQYQYTLERVYGTTGVAGDSEPWQTAWLNPENTGMYSTVDTSVQIDTNTLVQNANYVLYVRALDVNGLPLSSVTSVNFKVADAIAPVATITKPLNGISIAGGATATISATATDNIAVTKFELYIDGVKMTTSTSGSLSYSWSTKRVSIGSHTITVKAYDAANNIGTSTVSVNRTK